MKAASRQSILGGDVRGALNTQMNRLWDVVALLGMASESANDRTLSKEEAHFLSRVLDIAGHRAREVIAALDDL